MNNIYEVRELRCKSILVWLDQSGDRIWIRTNEPYSSAVEIEDAQAIQLADILVDLVRARRGELNRPLAPTCVTEGDKGFGVFYELPNEKVVFWGKGGGPLFIETKYPDNVPICLSFQEALEFAEKLIAIAQGRPE
jgi:hypothetical protein